MRQGTERSLAQVCSSLVSTTADITDPRLLPSLLPVFPPALLTSQPHWKTAAMVPPSALDLCRCLSLTSYA